MTWKTWVLAIGAIVTTVCLTVSAIALTGGTTNLYTLLRVFADSSLTTPNVATAAGELYVEGDIEADGNLNIAGTSTLTGNVTASGTLAVTGTSTLTGATTQTGDLTVGGAAGALTFSDTASSIVVPDNDASALDLGSTGLLNGLRYDSTDNAENLLYTAGLSGAAVSITGATTLDYSNCGKAHFVTAGIDTASITLPALATVTTGCELTFFYVGADGGALLDISPNASDGIEGTCTLAASIVTFSGTDDADIGLTKATGIQGDSITLVAGNADDWYVKACSGIWANN